MIRQLRSGSIASRLSSRSTHGATNGHEAAALGLVVGAVVQEVFPAVGMYAAMTRREDLDYPRAMGRGAAVRAADLRKQPKGENKDVGETGNGELRGCSVETYTVLWITGLASPAFFVLALTCRTETSRYPMADALLQRCA